MQTNEIQELLLDTIPAWHYWFARPFKRMLNDGVSLDMYYCIQSMRRSGRTMTMTELANFARMPKQQMSKLVDKLVEGGFAERLSDPDDRRVIRLRATEKADEYVASFLEKDAAEFRAFFDQLEGEERETFCTALRTIHDTFATSSMPNNSCSNKIAGTFSDVCAGAYTSTSILRVGNVIVFISISAIHSFKSLLYYF